MKNFQELVSSSGLTLPPNFKQPEWDPVPVLNRWNEEFGPSEGVPHWDGNAILRAEGIVDLTILPAEGEKGVDRVLVRVFESGVVTLSFSVENREYPLGAIENGAELRGMLRVLRVLTVRSEEQDA